MGAIPAVGMLAAFLTAQPAPEFSGGTDTITLVAQINSTVAGGTKITNTADVSAATADPSTRNNTSKVVLTTARR